MTRETVGVDVPGSRYEVAVGSGLLADIGRTVAQLTSTRSVVIVTDETVAERYGMQVDTALARAGFRVHAFTVPAGEKSKSWAIAGDLLEAFASQGIGRECVVVALGGGVIGDLAGFVAATYMRGVEFVQVPTTLLAMVDSSVGGKTAVDLTAGKNLAGAFKQPRAVIADTDVLASLPEGEWRSGLAEVAKTAVLEGDEFLSWIEQNADPLLAREQAIVAEAVVRCVRFKAAVVARDEKEEGPRECLNYGHTFGHALEKVLGYGVVSHGAAVAEGMRFAARISVEVAGAQAAFVRRQDRLLDALGLERLDVAAGPHELLEAMYSDKKARAGAVRMVLVDGPGIWRCERVQDSTLREHLEAWKAAQEKGSER